MPLTKLNQLWLRPRWQPRAPTFLRTYYFKADKAANPVSSVLGSSLGLGFFILALSFLGRLLPLAISISFYLFISLLIFLRTFLNTKFLISSHIGFLGSRSFSHR